jgi:penicillin-binding protein 1A
MPGFRHKKIARFFIALFGGAFFGMLIGAFVGLTRDLPQIRSLESFSPPAVTRIYSADNVLLAELFVEKRDPVPLDSIPYHLRAGILATEDRNFFKHSGVDLRGILRAVVHNIRAKRFVEGASTITQQLTKTLFLNPRKTLIRKIKEAILAFQLERRYTKDEILELYLNQIYFGSGAYGVESAARIFFGKSVSDLNIAECALIAAMPRAPSRYSPLVNKPLSLKRRNIVLKQMLYTDIISETDYLRSSNSPVVTENRDTKPSLAPCFTEYIKTFLEDIAGSSMLYKGGLTIFTSLSSEMQKTAEQALANRLYELRERMKRNKIRRPAPQGALIALNVQSGEILAMVGGKNAHKNLLNRAVNVKRSPGSAFETILYAYAVEQGFSQSRTVLDAPAVFERAKNGKDWAPENASGTYKGEVPLRRAFANSMNIPALRLTEMLGAASAARFGRSLGIESPLSPELSLCLGTSDVTLLELTAAYSVFANKGELIKPYGVREVRDQKGRVIWRVRPEKTVAMSRAGAAVITNMLEAVIKEGTGKKAKIITSRPIAGKTGTAENFTDALFIGFSPSIATGVWVGQDNNASLGEGETGSRTALPIWIDFMTKALENSPFQYFDIPDDVIQAWIDPATGQPVPSDSPQAVPALFKTEQ